MAQNAPNCRDTQEVQFKLQDKFVAFRNCGKPRSNVKLLAVSSSRGLLFAGNPTAPELKVIIIKDVTTAKTSGKQPQARQVSLPHIPNYMSCSADGNLLAINYTQPNGTSLLLIYAVQSFMTPEVRALYNIRLTPEDHVQATQLLWNPVLPNSLAVVLSNGGLCMYVLKEGGNFELHTLDKSQQVKCGCWSPKGKQLVLGFPSGRLQQFKPDLTPAKTLACPPNLLAGPFDTIAIHWLSTFQFATIFLEHGVDKSPALFIINAPKAGTPSYTNYYDICYSLNGPRKHQFDFTHVPQWNLLLLSSANGVEVGVLGTSDPGDTPTWQQYTLLDEARIELPLSDATQDETFPLGFVYDTSSLHQLIINEQQLPSMPMVHVLGTEGLLLTFNFLNLQLGAASVCSPPPPLADTSGQFCALNALLGPETASAAAPAVTAAAALEPVMSAQSDISFAFTPNTVTSTPAPNKDKPPSLFAGFGNVAAKPSSVFGAPAAAPLNFSAAAKPMAATGFGGFGAATGATAAPFGLPAAPPATNPGFGLPAAAPATSTPFGLPAAPAATGIGFGLAAAPPATNSNFSQPAANFSNLTMSKPAAVAAPAAAATIAPKINNNAPLYTVQPTFTPAAAAPAAVNTSHNTASSAAAKSSEFSAHEVDDVIAEIMNVQIVAFSEQIEQQKQQTKALLSQIEAPNSIRFYAKRLDDLQELNDQANDVDFELDVQGLRHALSEAYTMLAECRAKLDVYWNPDITRLMSSTSFDASGRRLLSRLQSYLAANEAQFQLAQQQIDAQWEQYQDVLRRSSKSKMHMPCLEGIYQRLTRLQNLASDQRITQNNIKSKLKERGLLQSALLNQENNRKRNNEAVDNLADSILSMSLNQVVESNRAKLSQQKLQNIRTLLKHHKINIISPQRPDRVGLKSEVILETKLKAELKKKTAAATAAAAAAAVSAKPAVASKATQAAATIPAAAQPAQLSAATQSAQLAKPTASKPAAEKPFSLPASVAAAPSTAATFSFSMSGPFAKTTASTAATTTTTATLGQGASAKPTTTIFGGASPFNFGELGSSVPIGGLTATVKPHIHAPAAAAPNLFAGFGTSAVEASKPKPTTTTEQPKVTMTPVLPVEAKKELPAVETEAAKSAAQPAATVVTKTEPATKPFTFANFGNNAGTAIGGGSSFSFAGFGAPLNNTAAANLATSTPSSTFATAATAVSTSGTESVVSSSNSSLPATTPSLSAAAAVPAAVSEPLKSNNAATAAAVPAVAEAVENLFGSVNICKPQVKDKPSDAPPANIFGGFGQTTAGAASSFSFSDAGNAPKSIFGSSGVVSSTDSNSSNTPAITVAATATATAAATPATAPTTPASTTAVTAAATPVVTPVATPVAVVAPATAETTKTAPLAATTTAVTAAPGSSFSFSNAFSSLSTAPVGSPASTASNAPSSIFGGGNAFASATPQSGSPFQSTGTAAVSTGNLFGSVPKPDASVFGNATAAAPPTGLFAAAAASSSPSPFGSSPAAGSTGASGGNIFAQAAAATAAVKPGGFGTPTTATTGGSIFGGGAGAAAGSPFGSSSIFGGGSNSAQSPTAAPATGSIFGQNAFGATAAVSGGSIFGGASATPTQATPFGAASATTPQTTPFGAGGGSIFGAAAANTTSPAASGGSIFGGGSSGGFGSFAQTAPAAGAFGSGFAQSGGASVAQTGFGSPQQTAQSPAGGFGAKPVFGGSPAFGSSPTFGGAATFGSPKGFGAFGGSPAVVSPPAFGGPPKAQDGNIFDTLGGTDAGLSFGNLAQTGNPNGQKPAFGGSSFMNYR